MINKFANKLSEELAQLIDRVRLVPMNKDFDIPNPNFREECLEVLFYSHKKNLDFTFSEAKISSWIRESQFWLQTAIKDLSHEFRDHIIENELEQSSVRKLDKEFGISNFSQYLYENFELQPETIESLLHLVQSQFKYEEFYKLRNQFYLIIQLASKFKTQISQNKIETYHSTTNYFPNQFPIQISYELNSEGVFHSSLGELLKAIDNKNIYRIRICQSCKKVFWANRSDAKCCSKECLNLFHVNKSKAKRKEHTNYFWQQDMKNRANSIAKAKLKDLGFTDSDIEMYRKKKRKSPHRVIYDYLIKEVFKPGNKKSVEQLEIPIDVIQPLQEFLNPHK